MSFSPPAPRAPREELESALEVPNAMLREAAGLAPGISANPGLGGVDVEAAIAEAEHDYIAFRDLAVHLEVHAVDPAGPTMVFHHGLGDHVRRFTPLAGLLAAEGINSVLVDRPGHGLSQGHRGHCPLPWALEVVEASLRYARDRFGGPLVAVGDSLGGITLWYALTRQVDVEAMVCHCIGHPDVHHDPSMRWKGPLMRAFGRMAPRAPIPVRQIADYDEVALDPRTQANFDAERDPVFNFTVTAGSAASYVGFQPDRSWQLVETPVAVWIGDHDAMVTPAFTRRSFEREHPPGAHYEVLEGQGHQTFLDHLDESGPRLAAWIRETV